MIKLRMVIYLLIISYIGTIGHNFIPHHHHNEGQENPTQVLHHHLPLGNDESDGYNFIVSLFSNILHHDDNALIVNSSLQNEYESASSGIDFGLFSEISIFENFTTKNKKKHLSEAKTYFRLHQENSHGLRAPPAL